MTALQLFLYIILGISLQVALYAVYATARHYYRYRHMRERMAGLETDVPEQHLSDYLPSAKAGPWKGLRDFKVVRKVPEDPAGLVCSFYLEPVDGAPLPDYKPGQFLTFQLTVKDPETGGPKDIVRCYSLSDAPGKEYYRVSIKRVPPPPNQPDAPPGLSSNHFHDNVREGDVLKVRAPSGHFFLKRDTSPVVLVAGGIGITPLLSMLNDTINSGSKREIWLFLGVTNSSDHPFKEHLEQLADEHENFHLQTCYAKPLPEDVQGKDFQHEGYISIDLLRLTLAFQVYDFLVCGPRPMMETIIPALDDWGVPDQHIHYEAFGPASITRATRKTSAPPPGAAEENGDTEAPALGGESVEVTFAKSGKTLTWDGSADTLLDFAEQNGVTVDSGCRAGGCGACQTTIKSGSVAYTQAPDFDPDEGSCLICVSRPKEDLTLEA